jgi:hypothetical protein
MKIVLHLSMILSFIACHSESGTLKFIDRDDLEGSDDPVIIPPDNLTPIETAKTFEDLKRLVFVPLKCTRCHRADGEEPVLESRDDYRKLINFNDPTESEIYQVIEYEDMPKGANNRKATKQEKEAVLRWVRFEVASP